MNNKPNKIYAECNIVINPVMEPKAGAKKSAQVNMDIFSSQGVGPKTAPITLVIKGANVERLQHIMNLMTVYHKSDEELTEKVLGSVLADEVKGMSAQEIAAFYRESIVSELKEMGGADEDPLVQG